MRNAMLAVAILLVAGCDVEGDERGAADCSVMADGESHQGDASAPPASAPARASYSIAMERLTNFDDLGSCGFEMDWLVTGMEIDGDAGAWVAGAERAPFTVERWPGLFASDRTFASYGPIDYHFGGCFATLAADGSWTCVMERRIVEAGRLRCWDRYAVTGAPL